MRVSGIHLVRTAIAKLRRALGRFAEWSIKCRCEFGRITQNSSLVETSGVKRLANSANAAVHHVTGRDQVCARCRMRERRLHQELHGLVIENMEMVSFHACDAAVPV